MKCVRFPKRGERGGCLSRGVGFLMKAEIHFLGISSGNFCLNVISHRVNIPDEEDEFVDFMIEHVNREMTPRLRV